MITSGTQINTDPLITTNGATDFGKIYRGPALDGSEFDYLFGSTSSFDTTIGEFFNTNGNGVPVAVFKFSSLELTGDPTITIPSGATTFLGLVSVGDVTSAAPAGTILTFAGLDRLFIATQSGSITLGPDIAFSGISHLTFYARGTGSNLTLASPISGADVVHLDSEGTVQINGDITATTEFRSFSGGDFLAGTGMITAQTIDIESLSNLNIDARQFPNPTGDLTFIAGGTLNATLNPDDGGTSTFTGTSLTAQGTTINITSSINPTTFDLGTATVLFTAGSGGFQAPTIDFVAGDLTLTSVGDISVHGLDVLNNTLSNTVTGDGSFTAASDVRISTLTAGTFISIGGNALVSNMTAGTTIDVAGQLGAFGTVTAGGNITANGVDVVTIDAPNGVLTVGSNGIRAFVESPGGAAVQETFNVNSIVSPAGIDYSGNQFDGIDGLSSGGKLTINATTITFDSETGIGNTNFNGADAGSFSGGGPANGGDGGVFIVNTTGDITANNGTDITATTGLNSAPGIYSGAGGSVTLLSTAGMVTVNDTIQVSSDDSEAPRQSASGGTIDLQSDLTTGTGITVGANGQLLSLLNANAPGPGGSITLSTMGADIVVNGTIEADRGTITMDQNDPAGSTPTITIDGAFLSCDLLTITGAGDVNIGLNNPVTISANTISLSAPGSIQFDYAGSLSVNEFDAATQGGDLNAQISGAFSLNGPLNFTTAVAQGVTVANGASVTLNVSGDYTDSSTTGASLFQVTNRGTVTTGANSSVTVTGNLNLASSISGASNTSLSLFVDNSTGGMINSGGNVTLDVTGTTMLNGTFSEQIANANGGMITTGGNISGSFGGDVTETSGNFHSLNFFLDNGNIAGGETGGTIGTGGNINLTFDNNVQTNGTEDFGSFATGIFNEGGTITTGGNISVSVDGSLSCGHVLEGLIENDTGGTIGSGGGITFNITGDVNDVGNARFEIDNYDGGFIGSNAAINVSATNFSTAGNLNAIIDNENGGTIQGSAAINFTLSGNLTIQPGTGANNAAGNGHFEIFNDAGGTNAGVIGSDATVNIQTANISAAQDFVAQIVNSNGGSIGGKAALTLNATGDVSTGGLLFFGLFNNPGAIESDASVDVSAASLTAGSTFEAFIENIGGTIGGNATVQVGTTGNLNADHLFVVIDSSSGGSVGGNETINMNVSGTATVNNEATVQILGPDPTGSAAINFNGGTYEIGGTFFNTIDGNGTITFNNTDIHANVVQAGVFGANGSLIIGGSGSNTISADTLLKLYAPGSNGLLKFVANVTLSSGTEMDLAANRITINSGVTVTIAGNGGAANIYTNNANYTGFGGNGSTTGTFAGNGANTPQPLGNAPTFGATPPSPSSSGSTTGVSNQTSSSGGVTSSVNAKGGAINVTNSGQLLSLLNGFNPGPGGKINVPNQAARSRTPTSANATEQVILPGGRKNVPISGARRFSSTMPIAPGTH